MKKKQLLVHIAGVVTVASSTLCMSYKVITSRNNSKKSQGFKKIPEPGCSYPFVEHVFSLGELPELTVFQWYLEL